MLGIQRLFDDLIELYPRFAQGRRAGKDQKVLYDGRSAPRLFQHRLNLVAHSVIQRAFTNKVGYAQDRRKRIIQFVGHSRHHFAHRREFLFLHQLLFDGLGFRDVPRRGHHAIDLSLRVVKRACTGAKHPPSSIRMMRTVLELAARAAPGGNFLKNRLELRKIVPVNFPAQRLSDEFLRRPAEHLLHSRTYEGIGALETQHRNNVGEAGNQTPNKLLLFMQVLFHFQPLAHVHQRPLNAQDAARSIANHGAGVEAMDRLAILASQDNLAVLYRSVCENVANQ